MRKRILSFVLSFLLVLGTSPAALGAFEDFTDVSGHWAEDFLRSAVEEGFVRGYEDNTIRPDADILVNEMVVSINRVLLPQGQADLSAVQGIKPDSWYYADAAKAVNLGLLDAGQGALDLERPATREEIFMMVARAFGLEDAQPDTSCLNQFWDLGGMSTEGRRAAASLLNRGIVSGWGGELSPKDNISRAEFLTLLYRVAYCHVAPGQVNSALGNTMSCPNDSAATSVNIYNQSLDKDLTITCPASYVNLSNVKSTARVLVRSENLNSLSLSGGTAIHELVLAQRAGNVNLSPYGATVDKLVLASGGGSVSVSGNIPAVEISGRGRSLTLSGSQTETLVIGGANAAVTVNSGASLKSIVIAEQAENVTLVLNGSVEKLTVKGKNAVISGSGKAGELITEATAKGFDIQIESDSFVDKVDHGLEGIQVRFKVPEKVEPGGKLTVEGQITGVNVEKVCRLEWFEFGAGIGPVDHTLKEGELVYRSPNIQWSRNMPGEVTVGLKLSYKDEVFYQEVTVPIENYDSAYWDKFEADKENRQKEALALVSSEYKGDYTKDYAVNNDYSRQTKVDFVNGKGYASSTQYLIWVNRAYQHVNVFTGKKGEWKLEKEFLCGTGARYSQTPVGVYKTTYKQVGWFTPGYTVKPVVRFLSGSGYAFHSRLYYPGTDVLSDASIGFPVSHGCVRMYDEDVQWLYDYIPKNTTVAVF